ncbi:hypothetical protein ACFXPS_12375 [Nocardia sp. NPDC059091]|uniref:hypothetical protein n=1 Tax=unclassified Nocardia TaxID=2637762 RepID=UPI00367D1FAF
MPDTLPLARTNAEARLYLTLQPCPTCGETRCQFRSAVITVDGDLASRYTGDCPSCGTARAYEFRLPADILPPPADSVCFGLDNPSELLDPGVWLWYSDNCIRQVPPAGGDPQTERTARHTLATALAAVEETAKFLPPAADRIPAAAFTSPRGRATYNTEPGRFTRARLAALRDAYAAALADR